MEITMHEITVREICEDYLDEGEAGVRGYSDRLDIRPPYQREFIYDEKKRNEVIRTIKKGFPLNVMYWVKTDDDSYEIMDGQQRTISFCQYVEGDFSLDDMAFHNLTETEKNEILDYKCMVYICEGTDKEKLDWFRIINIAGEELTAQELRNAVYAGPWVTDARSKFSKTGCVAYKMAEKYMKGSTIRQDYLETAISWAADADGVQGNDPISAYMSIHQHDPNANQIWMYFRRVIEWVDTVFPIYRREMKGLPWGLLYNAHKDDVLDPDELEARIVELILDKEVQKKKGIWQYLLTGDERHLSLRAFDDDTKRAKYEEQKGICPMCKGHFEYEQMDGDHIIQWAKGGKTVPENCQMLCIKCNRSGN